MVATARAKQMEKVLRHTYCETAEKDREIQLLKNKNAILKDHLKKYTELRMVNMGEIEETLDRLDAETEDLINED